ncbi:hypothetical protein QAD02_017521 [Eretmocerus hayati]|uniref:Uncharacterized protein n=1 Tax=Eretmocerus hayati TaxID=131215 RepID=A0ACC2PDT0_9HYME|nr:hypothetical protein QAD02_017521 [Eretmocerus hayati]
MTSAKITARFSELIEEKRQQLAESQNSINRLFSDLDKLEPRLENNNNDENEDLTFEDDDDGEHKNLDDLQSQDGSDLSDCDLDQFLGEPLKNSKTLELKPKVAKKVQAWIKSGIQEKEDRQKILDDIPRTGVINLEAPTLNEEIASQLNTKELSRDNFFKLYQTIAGSTLPLASSMIQSLKEDVFPHANVPQEVKDNTIKSLSNIIKLNSDMYQMMCIGRKHFLVGGFEAKTKKALARAQPTQFLSSAMTYNL